jgi:glutathionyl-hydroquinone reductase
VLGWLLIAVALPRAAGVAAAVVLTVQPVGSVLLGIVLLGEQPAPLQLAEVAVVVARIVVATRRSPVNAVGRRGGGYEVRVRTISREQHGDGAFVRQQSTFREWVRADGRGDLPAEHGRYHLYVAKACPWASRVLIVRRLKRLESTISVSFAHPLRDHRGWAFPGQPFSDEVNGFAFLAEAYERSAPGYDARHSVPVLWDKREGRIVNNESADIIRMLNSEFDEWGDDRVDLYPADLRAEIDEVNERIYETVNNGVYAAGFATRQEAYHRAFVELFVTLDALDVRLGERRYLTGDRVTEADWRLFVTLVRFDAVYYSHFKCNLRRIVDYPNLWGYTRELYQWPGIAETVDLDEIKSHYYGTHPSLNPTRIIPDGPALDFHADDRRNDHRRGFIEHDQ